MAPARARPRRLGALFAAMTIALSLSTPTCVVRADDALSLELPGLPTRGGADRGCNACRAGNCSLAVSGALPGVYCGDLVANLQPCCCRFRNECMTTIFSDSCECSDSVEEEELLTTRFYLFVALTLLAWAVLIYDKMCGGPYKVANSSHVLLANSPSAARSVADSDSEDEANNSLQLQTGESDDSRAQVELTVLSSPRAGAGSSRSSGGNALNAESRDAASLGADASCSVSEEGAPVPQPSGGAERATTTTAEVQTVVASGDVQVALPAPFNAANETTESV